MFNKLFCLVASQMRPKGFSYKVMKTFQKCKGFWNFVSGRLRFYNSATCSRNMRITPRLELE